MDPADRSEPLTPDALPAALVEGFLRLCQGEFGYRLPRTMSRDRDDTTAFFFNTIAEELEEFADAVRGGGAPEIGGEYATTSLAVIRAGILSAREGRHVEIAEILAKD